MGALGWQSEWCLSFALLRFFGCDAHLLRVCPRFLQIQIRFTVHASAMPDVIGSGSVTFKALRDELRRSGGEANYASDGPGSDAEFFAKGPRNAVEALYFKVQDLVQRSRGRFVETGGWGLLPQTRLVRDPLSVVRDLCCLVADRLRW